MELHTRSTEANGFDRTARRGRTGHKERMPWLVGSDGFRKNDGDKITRAPLLMSGKDGRQERWRHAVAEEKCDHERASARRTVGIK
jgi:hypothetical protein